LGTRKKHLTTSVIVPPHHKRTQGTQSHTEKEKTSKEVGDDFKGRKDWEVRAALSNDFVSFIVWRNS